MKTVEVLGPGCAKCNRLARTCARLPATPGSRSTSSRSRTCSTSLPGAALARPAWWSAAACGSKAGWPRYKRSGAGSRKTRQASSPDRQPGVTGPGHFTPGPFALSHPPTQLTPEPCSAKVILASYDMETVTLQQFVQVAKALSDPTRVRILKLLEGGELCVCQLVAILGMGQSAVSQHLAVLRRASLIENRKEQKWVYCSLPRSSQKTPALALELLSRSLQDDAVILEDRQRCALVRKLPVKDVCSRDARGLLAAGVRSDPRPAQHQDRPEGELQDATNIQSRTQTGKRT